MKTSFSFIYKNLIICEFLNPAEKSIIEYNMSDRVTLQLQDVMLQLNKKLK